MTLPFPFPPDWSNTITERLSWLTAIQKSPTGAEQREALRLTPRRAIDYPLMLDAMERSYFDVLLAQNGGGKWWVPIPHEEVRVGEVFVTQDEFFFDASYREIGVGSKLLLRGNAFRCEMLTVTAITPYSVQTTGVQQSYPVATLTPTFLGVISDKVTASRPTARVYTATVRFTSLDPTIWPVTAHSVSSLPIVPYPGASGATFPILTMPPNAVNSLEYDYERIWSVVDNATSIPVYTDKAARQFTSQKYEFFLVGGAERRDFRDLLYALKGRCTPVWVPTFNDDVSIGYGYPNPMQLPTSPPIPGRQYYALFHTDGTVTFATLPAFPGEPPPVFSKGNVTRGSFMSLKRLDVDDIEIQHYTDLEGPATVSVIFRDAPDLRIPKTLYSLPFNSANYSGGPVVNDPLDMTAPVTVSSGT
jgi:hypothetical protein